MAENEIDEMKKNVEVEELDLEVEGGAGAGTSGTGTSNSSEGEEGDNDRLHHVSFKTFQSATDVFISKVTARAKARVFTYIKEHFRPVYSADREEIVAVYKSLMGQLETFIKEELEDQVKSQNVETLLNRLDTVKKTASPGSKWRPSGHPDIDVQAHLQDVSQYELDCLAQILSTLERENKHLNDCVAESDKQTNSLVNKLESDCQKWEQAARVISEKDSDDLRDLQMAYR